MNWKKTGVLITGGTGSFGKAFARELLRRHRPRVVRIFSRDELKQHQMQEEGISGPTLRYFIGDIRDRDRLSMAVRGVDLIVHAAALKQVPACEYNPFEAVKTNILGTENVLSAALEHGVERVLTLSTDKAVNPVNLYGATKLCAERITVEANSYAGGRDIRFSCVRYGNVLASRGSVVQAFERQRERGEVAVTDMRMTRFWIGLEQAVAFVASCVESMPWGEVFVPKSPSMRIADLARLVAPGCRIREIGIRPGEKIHEILVTRDESRHARDLGRSFVIEPEFHWWGTKGRARGKALPDGFEYRSDTNREWLKPADLVRLLKRGPGR